MDSFLFPHVVEADLISAIGRFYDPRFSAHTFEMEIQKYMEKTWFISFRCWFWHENIMLKIIDCFQYFLIK